ncbi:MAG: hypothetical protein AAF288_11665 [Planctomycetota bacterium]
MSGWNRRFNKHLDQMRRAETSRLEQALRAHVDKAYDRCVYELDTLSVHPGPTRNQDNEQRFFRFLIKPEYCVTVEFFAPRPGWVAVAMTLQGTGDLEERCVLDDCAVESLTEDWSLGHLRAAVDALQRNVARLLAMRKQGPSDEAA